MSHNLKCFLAATFCAVIAVVLWDIAKNQLLATFFIVTASNFLFLIDEPRK